METSKEQYRNLISSFNFTDDDYIAGRKHQIDIFRKDVMKVYDDNEIIADCEENVIEITEKLLKDIKNNPTKIESLFFFPYDIMRVRTKKETDLFSEPKFFENYRKFPKFLFKGIKKGSICKIVKEYYSNNPEIWDCFEIYFLTEKEIINESLKYTFDFNS